MAIGYQLKITIQGSKPPIWRRVIVPEHISFCDLDDIIEKVFGWTHSHLYEFIIKDWGMRITGAPLMEEEDNAEECIDSWMKEGSVIYYTYDFGDNWEHLIKVEKLVEYEHRYPVVLKSKGPNMIEDCGGIWGFYCCGEEPEEFDMESVNREFATWNIPVAEPMDELIDFVDDYDFDDEDDDFFDFEDDDDELEEWEEAFLNQVNRLEQSEEWIREKFGKLKTLEEVYSQYTKDNLVEIAKAHRLSGYSKYKKQRLVEWLVLNMLEEQHMLNLIFNISKDEMELFEDAIEEKGIFISEELIERSLFLSTYGGFLPYYNYYHVPVDVQNKYKELMTDSVRESIEKAYKFEEVCQSSIYLYGVISISELNKICQKYELAKFSDEELQDRMLDVARKDDLLVFKNGYLMDARLEEQDLYIDVLREQEKMVRYLPDDVEEFLEFGRNEVQEPDEDTLFFLEYIMKEANLDYAHALLAFYLIQEAIRMNQDDEELFGILLELGCSLGKKKQFDKAEQMIKKITNRTRKWDLNGHTSMELNAGIVEFPLEKRVYPNDPCPCGSGKKFKHCCGKRK